ncbi:hypothetical protein NDU88_005301 [Pleurodeles waltl]|uniref:Uncharacterized protein n=1 Tax=Pleurodeles waltl TaxID=8319 RepID=A0AAV7NNK9_PLEWA|nr:hypothetical protein NDU88_005301 [Pleurodeles waltl]
MQTNIEWPSSRRLEPAAPPGHELQEPGCSLARPLLLTGPGMICNSSYAPMAGGESRWGLPSLARFSSTHRRSQVSVFWFPVPSLLRSIEEVGIGLEHHFKAGGKKQYVAEV